MQDINRDDLLSRGKPKIKPLENPPRGFEDRQFYAIRMSGAQRDSLDLWRVANSWSAEDEKAGRGAKFTMKPGVAFRAPHVIRSLCDAEGNLLFDPNDPADLAAVEGLDGELLEWLYDEVCRWNRLMRYADEESAKNFDQGASDATGSSSPPDSAEA